MNKVTIFFLLWLILPAHGFEINTHQAITSCALSAKCITLPEYQGAQNLNEIRAVLLQKGQKEGMCALRCFCLL